MISGHPIPHDLIFSINTHHQPQSKSQSQRIGIGTGWGWFEMGRKTATESTRCRRTDGKKWRCSRQTSGDSKYCQIHMHRGKSRPTRNLVESKPLFQLQTQSIPASSHSDLTSHSTVTTNVKSSNFLASLDMDSGRRLESDHNKLNEQIQKLLLCSDHDVMKTNEKRQMIMKMYHQFIDESPSTTHQKIDSWLSLII